MEVGEGVLFLLTGSKDSFKVSLFNTSSPFLSFTELDSTCIEGTGDGRGSGDIGSLSDPVAGGSASGRSIASSFDSFIIDEESISITSTSVVTAAEGVALSPPLFFISLD